MLAEARRTAPDGNAVTPRDWRAIWLSEGFALYAQWMWAVEVAGESNEGWLNWARERDRISRAEAGPPGNWDRNHFGENNVYVGPALMLREINRAVGNTEFLRPRPGLGPDSGGPVGGPGDVYRVRQPPHRPRLHRTHRPLAGFPHNPHLLTALTTGESLITPLGEPALLRGREGR